MIKKLPLLFFLLLYTRCATAQSADALIRAARAASNKAIASHDVNGIVRDMLPDYSIVTGRGQHVQGRDSVFTFWQKTFKAMPGVVYFLCGGRRKIPGKLRPSCLCLWKSRYSINLQCGN